MKIEIGNNWAMEGRTKIEIVSTFTREVVEEIDVKEMKVEEVRELGTQLMGLIDLNEYFTRLV